MLKFNFSGVLSHFDRRNLQCTLRVMAPVFDGLLLFVALHSNVLLLCSRFPVMMIEDTWVPAISEMTVDPRYQVMVGAGTALLLTTHRTIFWTPSANVRGLSLGIKDTLCTSTVSFDEKNSTCFFLLKLLTTVSEFIRNVLTIFLQFVLLLLIFEIKKP